jgi:hypothetical protein
MMEHIKLWNAFSRDKQEVLVRELRIAHDHRNDNFQSIVLRLFGKADLNNYALLARGYPDEAAVVAAWKLGLVTPDYKIGE